MRITFAFATLWVLILSGCGPGAAKRSFSPAARAGYTGYTDPVDGLDYLHNGDPYVRQRREMSEDEPAPLPQPAKPADPAPRPTAPQPKPSIPAKPADAGLKTRVREFEISRFDKGENKASRFGSDRFQLKVFFRKEKPVEFNGSLSGSNGAFSLSAAKGRFRLKGDLTDSPDKTVGLFQFTDTKNSTDTKKHETIEISYRAFKARLTMRHDQEAKVTPGSALERQLKTYCDDVVQVVNHCTTTFGWVHNWAVINGPAFYLVDIVRVLQPGEKAGDSVPPVFSFKGESKRTSRNVGGDEGVDEPVDVPAESLNPETATSISMWGNSENSGRRSFEVKLQDKETKETNEIYLDVEAEQPDDGPELKQEDTPIVYGPAPDEDAGGEDEDIELEEEGQTAGDTTGTETETAQPSPANPAPAPKPAPAKPKAPRTTSNGGVVGTAYLATDMNRARPARMVRDFNRNKNIAGVQRYIRLFQKGGDMHAFFKNAFPFRAMLKSIANAYDVSPAFAYLSAIESEYLKNGAYTARPGDKNKQGVYLAIGPFQIHPGTATDMKLPPAHRKYFAPSACGAARYIRGFVDKFTGDNTIAILAYNQGGGAASSFIARYRKRAGKYAYTYADMERLGGVIDKQKEYVNKYLAAYFIASNMTYYGFDPHIKGAKNSMPSNGSVFPGNRVANISDATCREAVGAAVPSM